jgi:hypothetical protein
MRGRRGAIKLMDSLFHNTSIAELDLRNNQEFNEDAQDAILDAIDFAPQWSVPLPLLSLPRTDIVQTRLPWFLMMPSRPVGPDEHRDSFTLLKS